MILHFQPCLSNNFDWVILKLSFINLFTKTIFSVPAEMYKHGIQYWACVISGLFVRY